ncbi:hypothetical protein [Microbacter margulisiae]|uniref:Uncharacterized protein n=1 Tax=Microbacter margulisiae TaxID=1350067 RepID=A0A7W5H2A9_9PORP|nr:hypothetical protein [Microbacter margulisiae]MBB3187444.1 hypothetical protein [Microbacter margulisiae]
MSPLRGCFDVMGIVFYEDARATLLLYGYIHMFTKHPLPVKGRSPVILIGYNILFHHIGALALTSLNHDN